MNCANKALLVLLAVVTMGLWGCAQGSAPGSARMRDLESRYNKLEEDFRATTAARDQARQDLAATEQERDRLRKQVAQLQKVVKERDDLRQQLAARTGERDAFQGQLLQVGKDLQVLIGRIETATSGQTGPPLTSAAPEPSNVQDPAKS